MICYLCGKAIDGKVSKDHVPPKQFFPEEIRKKIFTQLDTLPAHRECNQAYQKDEDYFYAAIGPLAFSDCNPIGGIIIDEITGRKYEPNIKLLLKIFEGFDDKVGNIYIPNCISLKVEEPRIERICWKMIRGLYFLHNNLFLPEDSHYQVVLLTPEALKNDINARKVWEAWNFVLNQQGQGKYKRIFDYKYLAFIEANVEMWAMLLWDRLIIFVYFLMN